MGSNYHLKISLIHPSRKRPQKAAEAYAEWMRKASGGHVVEYILSIDDDDETINEYMALFDASTKIVVGESNFVVAATNRAAERATGDCMIYMSDDFGCPDKWDESICQIVKDKEMYVLDVDDCFTENKPFLPMPIISKTFYDKNGYFFHPDFKSMFCDNFMYFQAQQAGCLIPAKHLKFEHRHYLLGKNKQDDTYHRSNQQYENGRVIFNRLAKEAGWSIQY